MGELIMLKLLTELHQQAMETGKAFADHMSLVVGKLKAASLTGEPLSDIVLSSSEWDKCCELSNANSVMLDMLLEYLETEDAKMELAKGE